MSEIITKDSDEFNFGLHDLIFEDPEVKRQLDQVKKVNEYLAEDSTISDTRVSSIREQLDSAWPHMGEEARVSGRMTILDPIVGRPRAVTIPDKILVSNGWTGETIAHLHDGTVRRPQDMFQAGEPLSIQAVDFVTYAIRYHFLEPQPDGSRIAYIARVEDVAVSYPTVSSSHASNLLHYYHPEQMELVDTALVNATSTDEQLDNLKGLELVIDNEDREQSKQFARYLGQYVNTALDLDTTVPYVCVMRSTGLEERLPKHEANPDTTDDAIRGLVAIAGLKTRLRSFQVPATNREKAYADFMVAGRYIGPDNHDQRTVLFPLEDLVAHQSLRDLFYK